MLKGIQEKSNGTVPTSSAKGSGSGSKSSSPPVVEVSLPVSSDWSDRKMECSGNEAWVCLFLLW